MSLAFMLFPPVEESLKPQRSVVSERLQLSTEDLAGEYSIHFTKSSSQLIQFYEYLVFNIEEILDKNMFVSHCLFARIAHM